MSPSVAPPGARLNVDGVVAAAVVHGAGRPMPARVQRRTRRTVRDDDASVRALLRFSLRIALRRPERSLRLTAGSGLAAHAMSRARRRHVPYTDACTGPRTARRVGGRGDPTSRCSRGLTGADQSSDVILATALDRPGYWWPAALAAGKLARLRFTVVSVVEV